MRGLYIHLPFCQAKCAYCDFCSFADLQELIPRYIAALCREIRGIAPFWRARPIDTVYFGGGTPTLLGSDQIRTIWDACLASLDLSAVREATIEANPGTVSLPQLCGLARLGVSRISLGVQSLCNEELALLGRIHTAAEAREAVRLARSAGLRQVNLDLLYGLPRQTLAEWQYSLEQAVLLQPEHLSLYALALETGTPLARAVAEGQLPPPNDDLVADMYSWAEGRLATAGYAHYEVSNWARRDTAAEGARSPQANLCRHNLIYWRNGCYLGVGAGAASYDGRTRSQNTSDIRAYLERLERGMTATATCETLDEAGRMGETMMLALRLTRGMSWRAFSRRFGRPMRAVYGDVIAELCESGLLTADERGIRLTRRGRLLGNRVFAAFLP